MWNVPAGSPPSSMSALYLTISFSVLALGVLRILAQENINIIADNPRIHYEGGWVDQENGLYKYASGAGSSLNFSFVGSSISYHSVINPNGGVAGISIDNGPIVLVDESANATSGQSPQPAVLWSTSGLDNSALHVLNVSYVGSGRLGGGYVEFYYLEYSTSSTSISVTPSATHSVAASPTSSSDTRTKVIVGSVVGSVAGLLAISVVSVLIWRLCRSRNNRTASKNSLSPQPYTIHNRQNSLASSKMTSENMLPSPAIGTLAATPMRQLSQAPSHSQATPASTVVIPHVSSTESDGRERINKLLRAMRSPRRHTEPLQGDARALPTPIAAAPDGRQNDHTAESVSDFTEPPPIYDGRRGP